MQNMNSQTIKVLPNVDQQNNGRKIYINNKTKGKKKADYPKK